MPGSYRSIVDLDDDLVVRYRQQPGPYVDMWRDAAPPWLDDLELAPAPPFNRMGTHSLPLVEWFQIDERREDERSLRLRLVDERPDDVFAVLPTAEDAASEVFELVHGWATARGLIDPSASPTGARHPLVEAGLVVQDDLCIMTRRGGQWRLDGAFLCFPSVWRLHDKLGRGMAAIHQPVGHHDELDSRIDRFFDRMRVGAPVWRRNMSLKPTHALFLPISKLAASKSAASPAISDISPAIGDVSSRGGDGSPSTSSIGEDGSPFWIRSERQTLTKLPRTGAILFAIRTQIAPLSVLRRRPDIAEGIATMYESWDEEMLAFKMADPHVRRSVLSWLRQVAGSKTVSR